MKKRESHNRNISSFKSRLACRQDDRTFGIDRALSTIQRLFYTFLNSAAIFHETREFRIHCESLKSSVLCLMRKKERIYTRLGYFVPVDTISFPSCHPLEEKKMKGYISRVRMKRVLRKNR